MATAEQVLNKFNNIKTLPHVGIRLSKLISDENSSIKEFEEVIKLDPTLVVRLLRLVNSPYYGLEQKVETIERAVIFIGTKNLRNLVVMEALKDIFRVRQNEEIFSRSRLWLHCAAVSICSQMITERIFGQKGEDAFLCGILHDIGMIVENQVAKDQFAKACEAFKPENDLFTEYEQRIIGTDHCEIGYLLASEWNLPAEVKEGIRNHHRNLRNVLASEITGTVQIAEYMVCKLNFTALPGMNGKLSAPLAAHIRNYMSDYEALARDLPNEISKAKDLYDSQQE